MAAARPHKVTDRFVALRRRFMGWSGLSDPARITLGANFTPAEMRFDRKSGTAGVVHAVVVGQAVISYFGALGALCGI